jgi:hypothetical protein
MIRCLPAPCLAHCDQRSISIARAARARRDPYRARRPWGARARGGAATVAAGAAAAVYYYVYYIYIRGVYRFALVRHTELTKSDTPLASMRRPID